MVIFNDTTCDIIATMNILFCSNPLNAKQVDCDWQHEHEMAKHYGMNVVLLDYDVYKAGELINKATYDLQKCDTVEQIVYRGWMMPVELYAKLYEDLLEHNLKLINNPEEYKHCYYLPDSYELIKAKTPLTVVSEGNDIPDDDKLSELLAVFNGAPIIVKDYVKSQKHYWNEACYIPNSSDIAQVKRVINKFIELQGENFQGGLVLREFVELEPIGFHARSHMPLTKEYRVFVLQHKPISINRYWDDGEYNDEDIDLEPFAAILDIIKSNFFTVDIAKKKNGDWIIMELGDGQVAEYLGDAGLDDFYQLLI